jgi:hypothetical protein
MCTHIRELTGTSIESGKHIMVFATYATTRSNTVGESVIPPIDTHTIGQSGSKDQGSSGIFLRKDNPRCKQELHMDEHGTIRTWVTLQASITSAYQVISTPNYFLVSFRYPLTNPNVLVL